MSEAQASVSVDHATCIVSGMCASVAAEIFELDDDGRAVVVLQPEVSGELVARARSAEFVCPVEAISVSD